MAKLKYLKYFLIFNFFLTNCWCWNNGLARTPPMGWLSWERFACQLDCKDYPDDCISQNLYRDMIDRLSEDGYLKAGYKYVNIDDCWMEKSRDPITNKLVPDKKRFPSGIKKLADYAHSKGVLLGIYEDVGNLTCAGYPGTYSHFEDHSFLDVETFEEWGIDSVKMDGCYANQSDFEVLYTEYHDALSSVGKRMLYECSWPAYLTNVTDETYEVIKENCHYWRNYNDIVDSYESIRSIIKFYGKHNKQFIKYHGPGGWFDPDMLIIGNNGLSYEQSKTQMAFWCMWSAPLFMSNDLRQIRKEFKDILLNKHLIDINQDPLGIMAERTYVNKAETQQVWSKKLSPSYENQPNPYAVMYFNDNTLGTDTFMSFQISKIVPGINKTLSYDVYDLYQNFTYLGTLKPSQNLKLLVPTSGSVRIVKLMPSIQGFTNFDDLFNLI